VKGRSDKVYVLEDDGFKEVYDRYVITFFVKDGKFLALSDSLICKPTLDSKGIEIRLPNKEYTDLAVDWDDGVVFVSTFGDGYITIDELIKGECTLKSFNDGFLMTLKIRNLVY